ELFPGGARLDRDLVDEGEHAIVAHLAHHVRHMGAAVELHFHFTQAEGHGPAFHHDSPVDEFRNFESVRAADVIERGFRARDIDLFGNVEDAVDENTALFDLNGHRSIIYVSFSCGVWIPAWIVSSSKPQG